MTWRLPKLKSRTPLYVTAFAAAAFALTWASGYSLAFNPSMSMPRGLYLLHALPSEAPLHRGDVVAACIPNIEAAKVYRERNYMGTSTRCASSLPPVMKPIAGLPGDTVKVTVEGVWINGRLLPKSRVFDTDSDGHTIAHLPHGWLQTLAPGEFFLLANHIERSLDSRYYGPIQRTSIGGRVRPLFIFE